LLIPLNVTGAWNTFGDEVMRAPQAHGAFMLLGVIALLMGVVAYVRTTGQALLAGLVLLGTPVFVYEGPREAADLTLSFFVLVTAVMFFLYNRDRKPAQLILAGLATGLAAWTKNEGLLFMLAAIAICALLSYRHKNYQPLLNFAEGLAFPVVIVLYFKFFLAPANDILANANETSVLGLLTDANRYSLIFAEFIDHIVWFGRTHVSIFAILLVYLMIIKLDTRSSDHTGYMVSGLLLAIQFFGYFAIYLVTPHDLDWHLRTSLGRLIMHLYPSALFLFFAALTDPETVFTK
jgi:4-amino-4-deoxy-L-arabinose transferase-like glycosyltransferase